MYSLEASQGKSLIKCFIESIRTDFATFWITSYIYQTLIFMQKQISDVCKKSSNTIFSFASNKKKKERPVEGKDNNKSFEKAC